MTQGLGSARPRGAVVTGGSAGIGRAVSRRLTAAGYRVVNVQRSGPGVKADLSDCGRIPEVWAQVLNRLSYAPSLVVLNAGACVAGRFTDLTAEDCRAAVELNLISPMLLAREALSTWVKLGMRGHLVLIGSQAALPGAKRPGEVPYAAAKGGIHAMIGPLASEYGPLIRVNAIAPGDVATASEFSLLAGLADKDETRSFRDLKREVRGRAAIGRLIRPREVAEAVMFIENCTAISGATINVSGGASAH